MILVMKHPQRWCVRWVLCNRKEQIYKKQLSSADACSTKIRKEFDTSASSQIEIMSVTKLHVLDTRAEISRECV